MTIRALFLAFLLAGPAFAQGAGVSLGGLQQDTGLPVEVTAESLSVNQADGTAVFTGDVVVTQGEMRLAAPEVTVNYDRSDGNTGRIVSVDARGGVTLATGAEAAEAREATYTIDDGKVVMTGDVVLTQGPNALAGERLVVDLVAGTGTIEGGVRTIFRTGGE